MSTKKFVFLRYMYRTTDSYKRMLNAGTGAWVIAALATAFVFGVGDVANVNVPLRHIVMLVVAYGVCGGLTFVVIRRALRKVWSDALGYAILAAALIMCVGISVNISGYLDGSDDWNHLQLSPFTDLSRNYNSADEFYHGRWLPHVSDGYTYVVGSLMKVFGTGLTVPLVLNMSFTLVTIASSAEISATLSSNEDKRRAAFWGGLMCAAVSALLWYGTILMKEAGATAGMALFSVALAKAYKGRWNVSGVLCAAGGGLLLMVLKSPLGWFALAGTALACVRFSRGEMHKYASRYRQGIYLAAVCGVVVVAGSQLRTLPDTALLTTEEVVENVDVSRGMLGYDTVQQYASLMPDYYASPLWKRALLLPMTASAQYFPPFPWNFTRDAHLGHFVWWAHLSVFWYLVGGLILGYFVLCFGRKRQSVGLNMWALWWLLCWLGVAFASAGSVSRYWLPFLPAGIALAVQLLINVRTGIVRRRAFYGWAGLYVVLLLAGLTCAYAFLHQTS